MVSTVNWVTQTSFDPPLIVKVDSLAHDTINETGAYTLFTPLEKESHSELVKPLHRFLGIPRHSSCTLLESVVKDDHSIFVSKVVNAGVKKQPEGRVDRVTLWLKDLGENVFYDG